MTLIADTPQECVAAGAAARRCDGAEDRGHHYTAAVATVRKLGLILISLRALQVGEPPGR
jgi:hypothetical protein